MGNATKGDSSSFKEEELIKEVGKLFAYEHEETKLQQRPSIQSSFSQLQHQQHQEQEQHQSKGHYNPLNLCHSPPRRPARFCGIASETAASSITSDFPSREIKTGGTFSPCKNQLNRHETPRASSRRTTVTDNQASPHFSDTSKERHDLFKNPLSRLIRRNQERPSQSPLPATISVPNQCKQQQSPCQQHRHSEVRATTPVLTAPIPVRKVHVHHELDEDIEQHLHEIYNMRTWDMYLRINDARKQQLAIKARNHHIPKASICTSNIGQSSACQDCVETESESTCSPYSDYGWYDEFPSSVIHSSHRPTPTVGIGASSTGSTPDSSDELIFGDLDL